MLVAIVAIVGGVAYKYRLTRLALAKQQAATPKPIPCHATLGPGQCSMLKRC